MKLPRNRALRRPDVVSIAADQNAEAGPETPVKAHARCRASFAAEGILRVRSPTAFKPAGGGRLRRGGALRASDQHSREATVDAIFIGSGGRGRIDFDGDKACSDQPRAGDPQGSAQTWPAVLSQSEIWSRAPSALASATFKQRPDCGFTSRVCCRQRHS